MHEIPPRIKQHGHKERSGSDGRIGGGTDACTVDRQVVPCAMNRVKRLKGSHVCTEKLLEHCLDGARLLVIVEQNGQNQQVGGQMHVRHVDRADEVMM